MIVNAEQTGGSPTMAIEDSSPGLVKTKYRLSQLALSDVVRCGYAIRQMQSGARSLEEVAQRIVRHLFESCRNQESDEPDIALVRFFKTHPYGDLDDALRRQALALSGADQIAERTKCLVLLATAGERPEWNSRGESRGHQAIPLVSEKAVSGIPMISQLIRQFGLDLSEVVAPAPELLVELDERNYNVFHVEHAAGNAFIPAQREFVAPQAIRSVIGFGGMLPTGNLFAVIVFAKCHISRATAEAFRTIALKVKASILPFEETAVFRNQGSLALDGAANDRVRQMSVFRSRAAALEELEKVYDRMVIEQSTGLEQAVHQLEQSNRDLHCEIEHRKRAESERQALYEQLVLSSRLAGMSDVATGVLHNVGNILNSVNVSATLVADRLRRSPLDHLTRALDILLQHREDLAQFLTHDAQGRQVPAFLERTVRYLDQEQKLLIEEMEQLTRRVEHIKTVVQTQQSYAGVSGTVETVDAAALIDDAIRLNAVSMERHNVEIVRDYQPGLWISLDKQKLMQVLVNIIKNAKEAVVARGAVARRVIVRARITADQLQIAVTDTGPGIAESDLTRIFSHGFTTKKGGHGFGLHSSANAAKELGGTLRAQSDGPGRGATFIVELPCQTAALL